MGISRYENKLVVRSGDNAPSPFLVKARGVLTEVAQFGHRALDLGCGGGRQSEYLKGLGFDVLAFDRKPDYGHQLELGVGPLPVYSGVSNVIVLSYVLMFLELPELNNVVNEVFRVAARDCVIIVELASVKNGLYHGLELRRLLTDFERLAVKRGFEVVSQRTFHRLFKRIDVDKALVR